MCSEVEQRIQALVTGRQQIVEILRTEKNRRAQLQGRMRADVEAHIEWLKQRVEQLEDSIQPLAAQHTGWTERPAA